MKSSHWLRENGFFSSVKRKLRVRIAQEKFESTHWSRQNEKFSLVKGKLRILIGQEKANSQEKVENIISQEKIERSHWSKDNKELSLVTFDKLTVSLLRRKSRITKFRRLVG